MEDFELISHELSRGGEQYSIKRIESSGGLTEELNRQLPDVVLCDHSSAKWDSFAVLEQVRAVSADLPFIIVTGAGEGAAVNRVLAGGADDLVLKHQLGQLGPAIRRVLRLSREVQLRRKAEAERDRLRRELKERSARSQAPLTAVRICAECKKIPDGEDRWIQLERYFRQELGIEFTHGLCPACVQKYYSDFR